MKNHPSVNSGCSLVAEYVDEGTIPSNHAFHPGEAVRPQVVGSYLDVWGANEPLEDPVMRTLLDLVRAETDGPSRAKMVETIARLQAVNTMRKAFGRHPKCPSDLCSSIARVFSPESRELELLLAMLREMMRAQNDRHA